MICTISRQCADQATKPELLRLEKPELCEKVVLITGILGAVGFKLAQKLLQHKGARVVGVDNMIEETRSYEEKRKALEELEALAERSGAKFVFYKQDIREQDFKRIVVQHRPEVVIHAAAMVRDRASVENPREFLDVNILGTENVLNAIRAAGCVGSVIVLGSRSAVGESPGMIQGETDPLRPINPYGLTKASQELLCYVWHVNHGLPITVLRLNPQVCFRTDMMPRRLLTALHFNKTVYKYGDGSALRDWVHIEDTADALLAAACRPMGFQLFIVGSGKATSLNELIHTAAVIVGREPIITELPRKTPDAVNGGVGRSDKISKELGWAPKRTLEQGLMDLYAYLRRCDFGR